MHFVLYLLFLFDFFKMVLNPNKMVLNPNKGRNVKFYVIFGAKGKCS